jgi:hypothetical protein
MLTLFFTFFTLLILLELIKGLSANGTPPILQKYSWQLDLAYFMWSFIKYFRIILVIGMVVCVYKMSADERSSLLIPGIILLAVWAFVYWLFNLFWVGKYKFEVLKNPVFTNSVENKIALNEQVMGVDWNGVQKAYPVSMIFYHHQFSDMLNDHPIVVTYCGMCRSGRIYDGLVNGEALQLSLVGAITFNAILKDTRTQTWWRQETGEAVKGKLAGTILEDLPMEQMSLKNWLAKHPNSEILQHDPKYVDKYTFLTKLMNYEASFPRWFNQETPPLIIGLEVEGHSRAYNWVQLQKKRMVMDAIGDKPLLILSSEDGTSPFAYHRAVDGKVLEFEIAGDQLTDTNTQSKWDIFGQCTDGEMKGKELAKVQIYQQFIRAWISFRPDSSFYDFN